MPALPTAPPRPVGEACLSADGQGTPPDQAIDWVPTEPCQAAFAEYTCGAEIDDIANQPLFACDEAGIEKYLLSPALIEGDQLATAAAGVPANDVAWVVDLEFDSEGRRCSRRRPRPWRPRASRRTGSPSCWTASPSRPVGQRGDPRRPGADRGQLQPAERD
jgi:hypothetical protein